MIDFGNKRDVPSVCPHKLKVKSEGGGQECPPHAS